MKKFTLVTMITLLVFGCSPEAGYDVPFAVAGAEGAITFEADPKNAMEITITSPVNWSSSCKQDWVSVVPASGGAGRPVRVLVVAGENNEMKGREGMITFSAGSEMITIRVKQNACSEKTDPSDPDNPADNTVGEPEDKPFNPGGEHEIPEDNSIIAWWTLGDNDYMSEWNQKNGNCWIGSGWVPADYPEGSTAVARWHIGTDNSARTYILSSDGNGHWAVKPTWEGDNLVLTVPVNGLEKNDRITVRFGMSGVAVVPRYWILEYSLDGSSWTTLNPQTFTVSDDSFTASIKLASASTTYNVNESFVLQDDYSGDLLIRVMATHAKYQTGGGTASAPTAGSAVRFRPITSGDGQKGISVHVNMKTE